jgi:hypothetical protein
MVNEWKADISLQSVENTQKMIDLYIKPGSDMQVNIR